MTDTKLNFTPHTVTQFNESEDIIVILSDLNPKKEVVEAVEEPEGEDAVEEEVIEKENIQIDAPGAVPSSGPLVVNTSPVAAEQEEEEEEEMELIIVNLDIEVNEVMELE